MSGAKHSHSLTLFPPQVSWKDKLLKIHADRWEYLHSDFHAAAYALDPEFIDTAGIRKKGKVDFGPEFFMVNRALRAIRRADVCLLVLDSTAGVTEQDRVLAQKISDDGRACLVLSNKWDAVVDKNDDTYIKAVK
jgi:predicted GTPase